jgi:hypothetical protein
MKWFILVIGLLYFEYSYADEWTFSNPIVVSQAKKGVFYHLDASSRRSIAVSDEIIAVAWEDNRSGMPQIYIALKKASDKKFQKAIKISDAGSAYEPCIIGLNDGRFIIGWEANKQLWLRVVSEKTPGKITRLTSNDARQVVLNVMPGNKVIAAWAERRGKAYQIHYAKLQLSKTSVNVVNPVLVDKSVEKSNDKSIDKYKAKADQAYPSLYQSSKGTVVAWEDRRFGNTQIFTAFAGPGEPFSPHRVLNDFRPSRIARFGNGTGAMRVTLDGNSSLVLATWLDKRDFEGGYDVYAAISKDGGATFGNDELVQDMFGENTPQWHNSGAVSHDKKMVSVWDDTRDEISHLWFSERLAGEWTTDAGLTENDESKETHAVLVFDSRNQLHVAYVEYLKTGTRIMYLMGHR